eukprot:3608477-Pyramimonas_sp.AAC.2
MPHPTTNRNHSIGICRNHRPIPVPQYEYAASTDQWQSLNRNMPHLQPAQPPRPLPGAHPMSRVRRVRHASSHEPADIPRIHRPIAVFQ